MDLGADSFRRTFVDIIKLSNLLRVISPTLPDLLNLKLATMPKAATSDSH